MSRLLPLLLCAGLLVALAGCGQRGDLYLPEPQPTQNPDDPPEKAR
jgi:predicted small lipoprotein YifL